MKVSSHPEPPEISCLRIYVKLDSLLHCYAVGSARTWFWPLSPSVRPSLTVPTADRVLPHVLELTADSWPTCCILASFCNSQRDRGQQGQEGKEQRLKTFRCLSPQLLCLGGLAFLGRKRVGVGGSSAASKGPFLKTTTAQNKPGHCVPGYKYWFLVVLTFCS